jgi:hypothetical protein
MSNLTWTDNRHNIPKGHAPKWEWEDGATSTFKVKSGDAFWRITPIHTVMAKTVKHHSQFAERTMWYVEFGSEHNRWTAMEHGFTYDQEWVPNTYRWTTCKETQRMLFYSLDHAKAFCEQTYGFSTMVDTRVVV